MPNIVEILIQTQDKSAEGINKARENLKGLGDEGASTLSKLEKLGTLAIGAGLAAGAAGIVESVHAYAQMGEEVLKLQRVTGGTAEELSHLTFAARENGVEFDTLQRSIGIFNRNLVVSQEQTLGFSNSASTFTKAMQSLDVATKDTAGNMRPTLDVMGDLADRFHSIEDPSVKAGLAMQIFGRNGAALLPLLNQGSEGIAELAKEADALGVTLNQDDVNAAHQFTLANRQLDESLKGLEISVGQKVLPGLTQLAKAFTEGMQSGQKFADFMKGAAFGLAALWVDAMSVIANQIESIFERVINGVAHGIGGLADMLPFGLGDKTGLTGLSDINLHLKRADTDIDPMQGLRNLFPDITKPLKDLGDAGGEAGDGLNAIPPAAKDTKTALEHLQDGLKLTDQAAKDLFSKPTVERATSNLNLDVLNEAFDRLKDHIQPNLDALKDFQYGITQSKNKLDDWGADLDRRKGVVSDAQQSVQDRLDQLNYAKGDLNKDNDPTGLRGKALDVQINYAERQIKGMERATTLLDREDQQRQRQAAALDRQATLGNRQQAAIEHQTDLADRGVEAMQRTQKLDDDRQKIMQDELTLADQTLLTRRQQDGLFTQLYNDTIKVTGRIKDALGNNLIPSIDQVHQIAMRSGDVLAAIKSVLEKHSPAGALDNMAGAADRAAAALARVGSSKPGPTTITNPFTDPNSAYQQHLRALGEHEAPDANLDLRPTDPNSAYQQNLRARGETEAPDVAIALRQTGYSR